MNLSEKQIALIRDSHARLMNSEKPPGHEFYHILFNRVPPMRELFRDDIHGQGMRFMSAISVIVDNLDDLPGMEAEIEKLAAGHAHLPIRREWYLQMQDALIDTFAVALGERFTSETERAWRSAFACMVICSTGDRWANTE